MKSKKEDRTEVLLRRLKPGWGLVHQGKGWFSICDPDGVAESEDWKGARRTLNHAPKRALKP